MSKQLYGIFLSLLVLTNLTACKNNTAGICKKVSPHCEGSLQVGEEVYNTKVWQEDGYKYQFADIQINTPLVAVLKEMTGLSIDTNTSLATLVLYTNKAAGTAITNHIPINRQDILAAALYIKTGKEIQYTLYRNEGKIFSMLPTRTMKSISSNFILDIYKAHLPHTDTVSALCITNSKVLF